jgi:hypothetical protein
MLRELQLTALKVSLGHKEALSHIVILEAKRIEHTNVTKRVELSLSNLPPPPN